MFTTLYSGAAGSGNGSAAAPAAAPAKAKAKAPAAPKPGSKLAAALAIIAAAGAAGATMRDITTALVAQGYPPDSLYNPLNARVAAGQLRRLANGAYALAS